MYLQNILKYYKDVWKSFADIASLYNMYEYVRCRCMHESMQHNTSSTMGAAFFSLMPKRLLLCNNAAIKTFKRNYIHIYIHRCGCECVHTYTQSILKATNNMLLCARVCTQVCTYMRVPVNVWMMCCQTARTWHFAQFRIDKIFASNEKVATWQQKQKTKTAHAHFKVLKAAWVAAV